MLTECPTARRVAAAINEMPPIVISDVCDTLFYSNTTFDYIAYVLGVRRRRVASLALRLVVHRLSPLNAALIVLNRFSRRDCFKTIAVRFLRGLRQEELDSLAHDFFEAHLARRIVERTAQILLDYRRGGARIILVSASIEPVVKAIARRLGCEYLASQIGFHNGVATGKLLADVRGKKHLALARLGIVPPYDTVITDNLSDRELLLRAKEKVIVAGSKTDGDKWKVPDARLIKE
jgi:phosphoserine phosphatase